jgi:hypothetical protein
MLIDRIRIIANTDRVCVQDLSAVGNKARNFGVLKRVHLWHAHGTCLLFSVPADLKDRAVGTLRSETRTRAVEIVFSCRVVRDPGDAGQRNVSVRAARECVQHGFLAIGPELEDDTAAGSAAAALFAAFLCRAIQVAVFV